MNRFSNIHESIVLYCVSIYLQTKHRLLVKVSILGSENIQHQYVKLVNKETGTSLIISIQIIVAELNLYQSSWITAYIILKL